MLNNKGGRRAYLNDFVADENGGYLYGGTRYEPENGNVKSYCRSLGAAMTVITAVSAASGCISAEGSTNCFYVVLPLLFELIAVLLADAATVKVLRSGKPLREYIYVKSVKRIPIFLFCAAGFAAAGAVCTGVYIALNGIEKRVAETVIYIVLKLAAATLSFAAAECFRKKKFVKIPPAKKDT